MEPNTSHVYDSPQPLFDRTFLALFVLSLCPFDIFVGVGAFVIGLSQISSFLSLFTLRYYKNSVPCAKGYTENENKIIANLQFGD